MQILECQRRRDSPYRATMAQTHTGGNIYMDPGVLGLADEFDFYCEENSLGLVHAFRTLLGEWCPHMMVHAAYTFKLDWKVIAPKREWCPIGVVNELVVPAVVIATRTPRMPPPSTSTP